MTTKFFVINKKLNGEEHTSELISEGIEYFFTEEELTEELLGSVPDRSEILVKISDGRLFLFEIQNKNIHRKANLVELDKFIGTRRITCYGSFNFVFKS